MHDLCIFVGVIDGGVETIGNVAAVGIAITECDSVCACSLSHNAGSKMSVCE